MEALRNIGETRLKKYSLQIRPCKIKLLPQSLRCSKHIYIQFSKLALSLNAKRVFLRQYIDLQGEKVSATLVENTCVSVGRIAELSASAESSRERRGLSKRYTPIHHYQSA
jgi:hypothetical protein